MSPSAQMAARTFTASGDGDETARLWDAQTGAKIATLPGYPGFDSSVVFSPDGTRFVTLASSDKTARLRDTMTGAELAALKADTESVYSMAFSLDGSRIVTRLLTRLRAFGTHGPGLSL